MTLDTKIRIQLKSNFDPLLRLRFNILCRHFVLSLLFYYREKKKKIVCYFLT